jgi:hypothetical protein
MATSQSILKWQKLMWVQNSEHRSSSWCLKVTSWLKFVWSVWWSCCGCEHCSVMGKCRTMWQTTEWSHLHCSNACNIDRLDKLTCNDQHTTTARLCSILSVHDNCVMTTVAEIYCSSLCMMGTMNAGRCTYRGKDNNYHQFLGTFTELYKATINFIMSIHPSFHMYQFPLDRFRLYFTMGTSMKICWEIPNLVKIRQKYWSVYMKTYVYLILNCHKSILPVKWYQAVRIAEEVQTLCTGTTMLHYTYIACLVAWKHTRGANCYRGWNLNRLFWTWIQAAINGMVPHNCTEEES